MNTKSKINQLRSKRNILISIKNSLLSFICATPSEEIIQKRISSLSCDMYLNSLQRRLK